MTPDLLFELELSDDLNAACQRKGIIGGSYLHIDLASGTVLRHELWIEEEPTANLADARATLGQKEQP